VKSSTWGKNTREEDSWVRRLHQKKKEKEKEKGRRRRRVEKKQHD
jgi:hypothetical protein